MKILQLEFITCIQLEIIVFNLKFNLKDHQKHRLWSVWSHGKRTSRRSCFGPGKGQFSSWKFKLKDQVETQKDNSSWKQVDFQIENKGEESNRDFQVENFIYIQKIQIEKIFSNWNKFQLEKILFWIFSTSPTFNFSFQLESILLNISFNFQLSTWIQLEKVALTDDYFVKRQLYPNVDFFTGLIYKSMGFPTDMFPVLFTIPRAVGWLAHW